MRNSDWRYIAQNLTLTCCQDHFLTENIQCGRSSPSQRWGADLRPQCTVKIQKTLKTLTKRSKELPEIFEIVLRPLWWATVSEQPSPPLHPPTVRGLLNCFQFLLVALDFFPPSTQYFSFFCKSYFRWTEGWTHGRSMAKLMHSIHPTPAVYDCCFFWLLWISFLNVTLIIFSREHARKSVNQLRNVLWYALKFRKYQTNTKAKLSLYILPLKFNIRFLNILNWSPHFFWLFWNLPLGTRCIFKMDEFSEKFQTAIDLPPPPH